MHAGRECVRVLTTAAALAALAVPASAFAPVAAGPRLACNKHASTLAFYAVSVRFPPSLCRDEGAEESHKSFGLWLETNKEVTHQTKKLTRGRPGGKGQGKGQQPLPLLRV